MRTDCIFISGMASSGKSTIAKMIAKKYKYSYYCGGDLMKEMAKDMGYAVMGDDFWDTDAGMEFLSKRDKDVNFDKKLDAKLIELADKGKAVFTTWTLPWLYKGDAVRIWFSATQDTRAERMVKRDKISLQDAAVAIKKRDKHNYNLYKKMYGIRIDEDLTPFDFVIKTDGISIKPMYDIVKNYIDVIKKIK